MLTRDPMRFKKIGVTPEEASYYAFIGNTLERIGDHAVVIAKKVSVLMDKELDERVVKAIVSASATSLGVLTRSIDSWFNMDLDAANDNIESLNKLYPVLEKINRIAVEADGTPCVEVCYVIESIRRTGEYSCNISEFAIDKVLYE